MEISNMSAEDFAKEWQNQQQTQPQTQEQVTPPPTIENTAPAPQQTEPTAEEPEPVVLSEELSGFFNQFGEKLYNDDLLIPFETEDDSTFIPKSLDDIVDLVKANKDRWVEQAKTQDKEALLQEIFQNSSPAFQFVAQNAHQFSNPADLVPLLNSVQDQDNIAQLDPTNEEHQEQIIRLALTIQGLDPNDIEDEVADLKERERLSSRAEKLKPTLDKYAADRTESILQEQAIKNQEDQVFWGNYYNALNENLIQAKEVAGMNISREHKAAIASMIIPDAQSGGLPIYTIIDNLVANGDVETLAQIALLSTDKELYDNYYGSRKASEVAKSLQRTLKTKLVSNSSQDTQDTTKNKPKNPSVGYGIFQ